MSGIHPTSIPSIIGVDGNAGVLAKTFPEFKDASHLLYQKNPLTTP